MKLRIDYVTNSSSSSFIIGKGDDASATVESVYEIIKSLYEEYINKKNVLLRYIEENPTFEVVYNEKYHEFKMKEKCSWEKKIEIGNILKQNFGISFYDYFHYDFGWLNCKTYKEYEAYWLQKFEDKDSSPNIYAPFTIADFTNSGDVVWLHSSSKNKIFIEAHDVSKESEIYEWYEDDLKNNHNNEIVFKEINQESDGLKHDCLQLGKICVYSECGYIPQYVVNQLCEISEYACNHMG